MAQDLPPLDPTAPDAASPAVEKKLEEILEKGVERIPQDQFPTFFRDTLIAFIQGTAGPRTDPETFKIAAQTVEKDNENKFTYLMRKLEVDTESENKDRDFARDKFRTVVKMIWPILLAVLVLVLGCVTVGIYLAATGRETLGYSILSAIVTAVFAYVGGLGTPRFWKSD